MLRTSSASAPEVSTPVGPGADDDEVQRPLIEVGPVPAHRVEQGEGMLAQPQRPGHRVEREGVLGGTGGAEEVRLRARGEHQHLSRVARPVGGGDRMSRRVRRHHCGGLDGDRVVLGEDAAQRPGDVADAELGGSDLVQQRLELVVVVPVDHHHPDVVLGQLLRAGDPGETRADDDDLVLLGVGHRQLLGGECGAPSRWSRWSPTRTALAIAVRAGLTALMLGKKLVSTT